ncbi:hypothetical protein Tco_1183100 [Tanacetum coccineum]
MNQNFNYSSGFDQFQPPQQFDNHQSHEIPEVTPLFDNEAMNELNKTMEDFMNQQREQQALFVTQLEQQLREQVQAAQREKELLVQKQAALEEEELSPDFVFRQLIEETCGTKVCEEQKKNMEATMLDLLEICRQKELLCIHDNFDDLFESALNSKLLLINSNSQSLNKEKQEVKNIIEPAAKRQTRITPCLKIFRVIQKESIFHSNKTPQISSVKAITPDLPIEEPDNSLSMGDEHLDTIPATESDEVIKSSVEILVPIPSEFEGISDDTCDEPVCDDSSTFDALNDNSEILSDSNNDGTSSDDDDFEDVEYEEVNDVDQEEKEFDLEDIFQIQDVILREKLLNVHRLISNIESLKVNSTPDRVLESPSPFPIPVADSDSFLEESDTSLSHLDNSLPEFETFSDHTEETRSGSTTTHANYSLPEYDSFLFEIEPDQEGLISIDNSNDPLLELPEFESFHFDPSFSRPPPEPPDVEICLHFEPDAPVIDNFNELNNDQRGSEIDFSEDDDTFTLTIRTFLPFLTYPEVSLLSCSTGSEDTIFDPGIST